MKSHRNVRVVMIALIGVVLLAGSGWLVAGQIRSPAQIAADTAPPKPSLITALVERRSLSTEVIVRGTGRYGKPQPISLPSSSLKTSTQIISRIAKPEAVLPERSRAMTVSGRPVFVIRGETPMHRDIGPGDSGEDVRQLERALARFGYDTGAVDGSYDRATAAAVAQMYRAGDAAPFGLTEAQVDRLNTAAATVATSTDHMLQMQVALRTARRGATPAEVNQARLDSASVAEMIPPVRATIGAARVKILEAQDLARVARRLEAEGDGAARRDVATAQVELTAKQNALSDAYVAQAEAQRALDYLLSQTDPPAATSEVEAKRADLRVATAKIPGARSEIDAAAAVYNAAQQALSQSSAKARDDGRKAARDLALARSDLREASAALRTLQRKQVIARARVRILPRPLNADAERQVVAAAAREVSRAKADLARLAARSGVQVPADEILFFPNTPVRVDSVTATPGSQASGDLMTVSNTTLAIDAALSPQDVKLVRIGMGVRVEDAETGIDVRGRVTRIASRPGTNAQVPDPTKYAVEITPEGASKRLVNTSVRLTIAVKSTKGKVLTVPLSALSVGADGRSRVQVDVGGGRTRIVLVEPRLAAAGNVEVEPRRPGALKEGDRVVIGAQSTSAAAKAPTGSNAPATPAGVSTTPSSGVPSGSGAGSPATTTPATPGTSTPGTTTPGATSPGAATTPAPAPGAGSTGTPSGTRGP